MCEAHADTRDFYAHHATSMPSTAAVHFTCYIPPQHQKSVHIPRCVLFIYRPYSCWHCITNTSLFQTQLISHNLQLLATNFKTMMNLEILINFSKQPDSFQQKTVNSFSHSSYSNKTVNILIYFRFWNISIHSRIIHMGGKFVLKPCWPTHSMMKQQYFSVSKWLMIT